MAMNQAVNQHGRGTYTFSQIALGRGVTRSHITFSLSSQFPQSIRVVVEFLPSSVGRLIDQCLLCCGFAIHEIQWSVQQQNSASSTLSQWQNETISGHRRPKFDLGGLKRLEATSVKDFVLAVNIVKVERITHNMTDFQAHHTCQFQAAQVWNRPSVNVTACNYMPYPLTVGSRIS